MLKEEDPDTSITVGMLRRLVADHPKLSLWAEDHAELRYPPGVFVKAMYGTEVNAGADRHPACPGETQMT